MRILVVEDEKKLAGFVRKGLEEHGFSVSVSHDGDEAYLLARVHAVLRRTSGEQLSILRAGELTVNLMTREVRRGEEDIALPSREFGLLSVCLSGAIVLAPGWLCLSTIRKLGVERLAREMARAHGGDLTLVDSSPQATTFALTFPLDGCGTA